MSVGKSVCKTGFCNFTSSYSSSHSSILVFQKGEMGGGGLVVWEVWGHLRVSWEDELGGKGRGGSVVVTKREKEEL